MCQSALKTESAAKALEEKSAEHLVSSTHALQNVNNLCPEHMRPIGYPGAHLDRAWMNPFRQPSKATPASVSPVGLLPSLSAGELVGSA